jgi:hypothetical protein
MIHPGTLMVAYRAMRDAMGSLRQTGTIAEASDPRLFAELVQLLGVPEALQAAGKYDGV